MTDAQVIALIAVIYQHAAVVSERHQEIPDQCAIEWATDLLFKAKVAAPPAPEGTDGTG